jgi:hypothetical protein
VNNVDSDDYVTLLSNINGVITIPRVMEGCYTLETAGIIDPLYRLFRWFEPRRDKRCNCRTCWDRTFDYHITARSFCVDGVNDAQVWVGLSPRITDNRVVRTVLSWNAQPRDLDLHSDHMWSVVSGNGNNRRTTTTLCSVGYFRKSCGNVVLDSWTENGGNNGVETQTIKELGQTVYSFYVNKYTTAPVPNLYNSGAQLDIYAASDDWPVSTIHIPGSDPAKRDTLGLYP